MQLVNFKIVLLLVLYNHRESLCANILVIGGIPSPSHHIWNHALARGLLQKGHNITYISPDRVKDVPVNNFTDFYMDGVYENMLSDFNINDMINNNAITMLFEFFDWSLFACQHMLDSNGLKQLLKYPSDAFDLILTDISAGNCLNGIIHKFNYPPTIGLTAFLLPPYLSYDFGNHLYPSYIPWYALPYTNDMCFTERVANVLLTYLDVFLRNYYFHPKEDKLSAAVFGDVPLKPIANHISLLLSNTDPILTFPQPISSNIIPVGGLHARPGKKLPNDIQKIMDESKHGIILFSLGTNVKSDKLGEDTKNALLGAFAQLKQIVLWKYESEITGLPKNVIVRKWLPQNDIMAHPNIKLFMSHGGALSTQEAMYHGVPVLGIPFIVDQFINIKLMKQKQVAEDIDFHKITTDYVLSKIQKVLNNPKFSENMKLISQRYKTQPGGTALERAILWIEYTLKFKGAKFLESESRNLKFYEMDNWDILLLFSFIIFLKLYFIYKIIRCSLHLVCGCRKSSKQKTE